MVQKRRHAIPPAVEAIDASMCPAKTCRTTSGATIPGRSVLNHCQIVGEVASELIRRYPHALQMALFPPDAAFAAACHDLGKVSPTFVEKLRRACTEAADYLPALPVNPDLEKQWGGHAGVSQIAAKALGAPQWVPEILGQHHGFSPQLAGLRADSAVFGGESWQQERSALVNALKQRLKMSWPPIASAAQARLVAGLTSVADWIGSGQHFENPDQPWPEAIGRAVDEAGFVPFTCRAGLSFEQIFSFPPRSAQQQLIDAVSGPGTYVLEAPMGLGKTEAALYAAYQMLQAGAATGIYFALPTQLTSNKIQQRFNGFLAHILSPESRHRSLLLHGKAWLQDTEMGEEGMPGGAWFHHAKRGLLAPFAVGTLDQALMAAMNVKHGFVRAFGLAGKVVILDEVHTYDAYTGTLLDALIELLRGLHCTVIILSATLNHERRSQMLCSEFHSNAYPLVTAIRNDASAEELAVTPPPDTQVKIVLLQVDAFAIQEALDRARNGQQVLWMENTVKEAQQRYLDLASRAREMGVDCGLLHSRFTAADRQKIEDRWVDLFGKPGWLSRAESGRILVGTQILEQSLDIDADFLVSRFAPTDMLLQRLGRLWRHAETPRADGATCEAWLLAPELNAGQESPAAAFGATAFVYAPYVLCRSLEVWQSVQGLALPSDIRGLMEATYVARQEQGQMARWLDELEHGSKGHTSRMGRLALQQLARIGLAEDGKTMPEAKAQTRYSENDNYEVLLLRGVNYDSEHHHTRLTLLNGQMVTLPTERHRLSKAAWKKLAATLMRQMVSVRAADASAPPSRELLRKLGFAHCFYLGDQNWPEDESLLRLGLVDEVGQLQGLYGSAVHQRLHLEYRDDLGYRAMKN